MAEPDERVRHRETASAPGALERRERAAIFRPGVRVARLLAVQRAQMIQRGAEVLAGRRQPFSDADRAAQLALGVAMPAGARVLQAGADVPLRVAAVGDGGAGTRHEEPRGRDEHQALHGSDSANPGGVAGLFAA
ncbi:MAG: hypothetical protein HYU41_21415 [Candidatus Rokubacteria bacterium]|nr:hypothetical protein [Candidatus Rokubacteria bacterium]